MECVQSMLPETEMNTLDSTVQEQPHMAKRKGGKQKADKGNGANLGFEATLWAAGQRRMSCAGMMEHCGANAVSPRWRDTCRRQAGGEGGRRWVF
jgi:hypothetical protein